MVTPFRRRGDVRAARPPRTGATAAAWLAALAAGCLGCSAKGDAQPRPGDRGPRGAVLASSPAREAPPPAEPAAMPDYEVVDPLPENPVLDMLLDAMGGSDVELRSAAVGSAASMQGEDVTTWLVGRMRKANPAARSAILEALGGREDISGLPTVLQATKDPDASVRLAAVRAAAALGREMVVGVLAECLTRGGDEAAEARKALLEMPGPEATKAVAQALDGASCAVRCALLEVLGGRDAGAHVDAVLAAAGDVDESVRVAALGALSELAGADSLGALVERLVEAKGGRELRAADKALSSVCARAGDKGECARAVLAALSGSKGGARCSLLRALGRLGDPSGLGAVRGALEDPDADVRDAGVRALAGWPDPAVAPEILSLARSASYETHRVLALRGYVRAAGAGREIRPPEDTLAMYRAAAELADELGRPQEKKLVLAGLAETNQPAALGMILPYLGDAVLSAEAAIAVVKTAGGVMGSHPAEARAALQRVLAAAVDEDVKTRARAALEDAGKR